MGCSKIMWFLHFLDDGFLILKVKCHISRDFMTFGVEFQFLGGFGVGIAFWDARSMKMMIIVPFYSALGGFGIMLDDTLAAIYAGSIVFIFAEILLDKNVFS